MQRSTAIGRLLFSTNIYNTYPMARPWGRAMGCRSWSHLCVTIIVAEVLITLHITKCRTALKRCTFLYVSIYLLPLYQWYAFHNYVCQSKTICSDNKQRSVVIARSFSYKYSQHASHGPPMRERHGASFMSSWSDPDITATIDKNVYKITKYRTVL